MLNQNESNPAASREGLLSTYHILTLYFPAVVLALGHGIATPAIPIFAKSFGTSFGVASLVIIMHTLGALLSAVPTGLLIDRVGRRPILLAGPVLMSAAMFLTATAGSFATLLAYRFAAGWAQEMWRQSRLAVIADVGRKRSRGRQMTAMVAMESTGRLLGPAVGGLMAGWSIRLPFVAHGILALAAIAPSFYLVRESAPPPAKANNGEDSELASRGFFKTLLDPSLVAVFLAQIFASMARGALWGGTLLLYAVYAYNVSPEFLGVLSTGTGVVGVPITLSAGYLMDRFGRKFTIVPGFALTATGLLFLALSAHWHWSLAIFVVAYVWVQGGQSITSGNMQVLASDLAPAAARGRFFGVWRLAGEIGHLLSPTVFAVLAEQVAYSASFSFLGLCAFAAALVIAFRVNETAGRGRA